MKRFREPATPMLTLMRLPAPSVTMDRAFPRTIKDFLGRPASGNRGNNHALFASIYSTTGCLMHERLPRSKDINSFFLSSLFLLYLLHLLPPFSPPSSSVLLRLLCVSKHFPDTFSFRGTCVNFSLSISLQFFVRYQFISISVHIFVQLNFPRIFGSILPFLTQKKKKKKKKNAWNFENCEQS